MRARFFVARMLVASTTLLGCSTSLTPRGDGGPLDTAMADGGSDGAPDAASPDAWNAPDAWSAPDAYSAPCPGAVGNTLDLSLVTLYANPPDLASWPVTTHLTEVDFNDTGVHVVFDRQDGATRWPDVTPPGWMGPLQYTLGMVECIDGHWYGSAVLEYWYGLDAMGGNVAMSSQVATNWYYDAARWGMLAGRQPVVGETIGIFVAAGNLRNITTDDPAQSPVMERSDVVLMPFPDVSGAMYSF
jgi:hypothetical protein